MAAWDGTDDGGSEATGGDRSVTGRRGWPETGAAHSASEVPARLWGAIVRITST